jgi:hypothetical protein
MVKNDVIERSREEVKRGRETSPYHHHVPLFVWADRPQTTD